MRLRAVKTPWLLAFALALIFSVVAPVVPGARATTVRPPQFQELVAGSDYIVRAVVKTVRSEYAAPGSDKILTFVELEVTEVIAGTPPTPLVLRMLGGRVGDDQLIVQGAPQFKVGDEDVLFVRGNGKQFYPLMAVMHGRYPVLREAATGRKYVARSNRVPLEDTAEVVMPMAEGAAATLQQRLKQPGRALTPEDFVRQIKAVKAPKSSTDERVK
jgi:hypothetical protein